MTEENKIDMCSPHMSSDIRELAKSFCIARMNFAKTGRDARNEFGKYNYAEIGDIYNAVVPHLCAVDIIIWHYIYPEGDKCLLETRLIHSKTGQWIRDIRPVTSEKAGNQSFGSANTYAKKNAVLSLCGIGQQDDDCAAEEKSIKEVSEMDDTRTNKSGNIISADECQFLIDLIADYNNATWLMGKVYEHNNISDLTRLPKNQFDSVVKYFEKNRKR